MIFGTEAVVLDIDNTLCRGMVIEGVGLEYLKREMLRGHARNVIAEVKGVVEIRATLLRCDDTQKSKEVEIKMMRRSYDILKSRNLGKKSEIETFAKRYLERNMFEVVGALLSKFPGPKFIVSREGSTITEVAAHLIGALDSASNIDVFDGSGMLRGLRTPIHDDRTKFESARRIVNMHGFDIDECTVIADGIIDLLMLRKAKVSVSAPFVKDREILKNTMIHL